MRERLRIFDVLRGFSVVSMVLFHYCYDLKFIAGVSLPWFAPPLQDIWRASISWTFLFVAGCMCSLSRSNLRRAIKYGIVAIAIYVATLIASVDTPISFGVIYCIATCTFVVWALQSLGVRLEGPRASLLLFVLFILCLHVPNGRVGLGEMSFALPVQWYSTPYLSWLGLPGPGFFSGDYYPLIPYLFLYLCGASMGAWWKQRSFPEFYSKVSCPPLEFVGRHALPIYIAHQPILLLLCGVF